VAGAEVDRVVRVVPEPVVVALRARVLGVDLDGGGVVRRLRVVGVVDRPELDRVLAVVAVVGGRVDGDAGRVAADGLGRATVDLVVDLLDAAAVGAEAGRGGRVAGAEVDRVVRVVPEPVVV